MYEAKTKATDASVASYLAAIEDDRRRQDCESLSEMMARATGCPPRMWGSAIVGFDEYHYRYASGHQGDSCLVGFASRKDSISIYLLAGYEEPEVKALLGKLGKHKIGKACLYVKYLSEVNHSILEQLIRKSVADTRRRFPQGQ